MTLDPLSWSSTITITCAILLSPFSFCHSFPFYYIFSNTLGLSFLRFFLFDLHPYINFAYVFFCYWAVFLFSSSWTFLCLSITFFSTLRLVPLFTLPLYFPFFHSLYLIHLAFLPLLSIFNFTTHSTFAICYFMVTDVWLGFNQL